MISLDRLNNIDAVADAVVTISGTGFAQSVTTEISGGDTEADNSSVDITLTYQGAAGTGDSASIIIDGGAANVVTIAGMQTFMQSLKRCLMNLDMEKTCYLNPIKIDTMLVSKNQMR